MKCINCGTKFDGNFCPNCGTAANVQTTQVQEEYTTPVSPSSTSKKRAKKKKPFYRRGWFIILAIIAIIVIIGNISGNKNNKIEKIDWAATVLGSNLPIPDADKGKILMDTDKQLWIDLNKVSEKEYKDYLSACKNLGYTVDAEITSFSYEAYNKDGYKLYISYIGDEMDIKLEAPMELSTIQWPSSTVGKLLPVPESTTGKFSYERETDFFVYVGNTTQNDFNAYIAACSEKGFTVDYNKGDTYYYADNADGYHISLKYEGNNIMSVSISSPDKDESDDKTKTAEKQNTSKPAESKKENTGSDKDKPDNKAKTAEKQNTSKPAESKKENTGSLDSDFKAAMDSYEEFMDEYVAFMKKFNTNPSSLALLADYAKYMSKYSEFVADFEKWDDEDMNDAESAYYIKVQTRVNKKLLEVAN